MLPLTPRALAALLLFAGLTAAVPAADIDPALGPPFTRRERPTLGPADAAVVVVEVRSFQCSHCRAFHERVFPAVKERYIVPGTVRWVMLDSPSSPDEPANPALTVARNALRQGRYWEMEAFLFENGRRPSSILFERTAAHPAIDGPRLRTALSRDEARADLADDLGEILELKIKSLPTFILRKRQADGRFIEARIDGYPTEDHFRRVLDGLLAAPE